MGEKDDSSFQFDQLQPKDPPVVNDEIVDLAETTTHMTCSCPKCGATIETPFSDADQQAVDATCAACNAGVAIIRESSANRAHRRSREISCANCGRPLDHHPHCISCGTLFPDYHVAVNPEDLRRRERSRRFTDFRQSLNRFNPSLYFDFLHRPTEERIQRRPDLTSAPTRTFVTPGMLRLVISLLVITVLISGVSYAFHLHQRQQQFAESYFKAVYGIKTGTDYNLKFCAQMAADWKTATEAGAGFTPHLDDREEAKSNRIRNEVDSLIQQMGTPPSNLAQAHQKLIQLRSAYGTSQNLASSPPNTLQALTSAMNQAETGFNTAAQELKSSMPESLKEEFDKAKQKYRGMKEF